MKKFLSTSVINVILDIQLNFQAFSEDSFEL